MTVCLQGMNFNKIISKVKKKEFESFFSIAEHEISELTVLIRLDELLVGPWNYKALGFIPFILYFIGHFFLSMTSLLIFVGPFFLVRSMPVIPIQAAVTWCQGCRQLIKFLDLYSYVTS